MTKNGRGGARPGAGRPPKALHYAAEIAEAEARIVAALPDVIDSLIDAAKAGDVAAGRYLLDRVWGRVGEAKAPWADDRELPFSEADFELKDAARERDRQLQSILATPYM